MALKTIPFDPSEFIDADDPEVVADYLTEAVKAAAEDNDHGLIAAALGDVAKARGMSAVAREAGVARETLYKALTPDGDPRLSTFLGVLNALGVGLRFDVKAANSAGELRDDSMAKLAAALRVVDAAARTDPAKLAAAMEQVAAEDAAEGALAPVRKEVRTVKAAKPAGASR